MTQRVKRPSFQWYPGDHRRDVAVRMCSFEARALWREMMDLMHDGEPYGHLTAGGAPIGIAELAHDIGVPTARVRKWLGELETRKVFSRTESGVIFSRRMVRDEHIRAVRADAGSKGGNPNLVNRPDKDLVNQRGKQKPTPSSSDADADAFSDADASKSGKAESGLTSSRPEQNGAAPPAPPADAEAAELPAKARELLQRLPSGKRRDGARQLRATLSAQGTALKKGEYVRAYDADHVAHCCQLTLDAPPDDPALLVLWVLYKLRDTYLEWRADAEKRAHAPATNGAKPVAAPPRLTFGQELELAREWARDHREQLVEIEREAATRFGTDPSRQRDHWCDEQLIDRWHQATPPAADGAADSRSSS